MSEEPIDAEWYAAPVYDPVERVARALCRYDHKSPDVLVATGHRELAVGEDGIAALKPAGMPAWMLYSEQAARFIIAMQALNEA